MLLRKSLLIFTAAASLTMALLLELRISRAGIKNKMLALRWAVRDDASVVRRKRSQPEKSGASISDALI